MRRLMWAVVAVVALGWGCTPGDGDGGAADAVTDAGGDVAGDVPAGPRVYSGIITFSEAAGACTAPIAVTWDGAAFEDVEVYPAGGAGGARCEIESTPGVRVALTQVTLRFGRIDDDEHLTKGAVEFEFPSAQQITAKSAWEGTIPSPEAGFQGAILEPFKNFTAVSWDLAVQ
jgi:hypothetical protein